METELLEQARLWADVILRWVGFGIIVGLLGKAIMPGRDPGGAVATLAMGIGGSIIGCGILYFFTQQRPQPISLVGSAVGIGGTILILCFYRLLGGYWFIEGDQPGVRVRPHHRRRRRYSYDYDE